MGAACTTGAARHVEGDDGSKGGSSIRKHGKQKKYSYEDLGDLTQEASSHLRVYQHNLTQEYVLLPKGLDHATAAELIGEHWTKLPLHCSHQSHVIERTKDAALASAAVLMLQQGKASSGIGPKGVGLELTGAGRGGEAEEQEKGGEGRVILPQWRPGVSYEGALRCRICDREMPNKALLNEHLAACLLIAEAREQTRASDEGLRILSSELHKAIEENMKVMLHTGKSTTYTTILMPWTGPLT